MTTNESTGTPADVLVFKGENYKVFTVEDWSSFGYSVAYGVRV